MGELGFTKFFGAALATMLLIMGLNEVATAVFGGGGHHGSHEYESQNEWAADKFHGYRIDIAETTSGTDTVEEVFDLGLALANADPAAGETVLNRQCATCHSWNEGGPNGTGPNLYGVVGKDIASVAGFNYSNALSGLEGNWTYEQMNAWLTNPGSFARGTSMAYAGLRSPRRDADRVNLIAYLASQDASAPAFPDPLPASDEETGEDGEAASDAEPASSEETTEDTAPADTSEASAEDGPSLLEQAAADDAERIAQGAESLVDSATETATDAAEAVEDAVTESEED